MALFSSLPKAKHVLVFFAFFITGTISQTTPPYNYCLYENPNALSSLLQNNFNIVLAYLSSNSSVSKSYKTTAGNGTNMVYGLYMCLDYTTSCNKCIKNTAIPNALALCPNSTDATIWEEDCQLHISTQDFFGKLNVVGDKGRHNKENVSDPEKFRNLLNKSLSRLAKKAAFDSYAHKHATEEVALSCTETISSLVQCTLDLSAVDCNKCLQNGIMEVLGSDNYKYRGGRYFGRSCYIRYEFYAFYEGKTREDSSRPCYKKRIILVVSIGLACILAAVVGSFVCCFMKRNKRNSTGDPFFGLATIEFATNNFSDANKLGEGGFGLVYKGTLQDGTEVAVKRLSHSSQQGSEEFINEVLLIMKLQHKNLVRLLGLCVDGGERLLVYELMSHGSLDSFLYDPVKRENLSWMKRLDIIKGIARGILYLHEDSRFKIIHRDLKPSNVLLGSELNPKISDFGNARIYGGNEDEASTAIVIGTYGYMAPEYAMEGIYSVKSDVFSFGIILLEMITGRKSPGFHLSGDGPSLQAYAWQMWNEEKGLETMDNLVADSCNRDEFLQCLRIALLCVQEEANDRPTMPNVVRMLQNEALDLRPSKRPAFSVGRFSDHYEASTKVSSLECFTVTDLSAR